MRRGIGIAIAWVAATVVAVFIAAAAVGSVRSSVTDTPTLVGSPSAAALATSVPSPDIDPPPSSSTTRPTTTSTVPAPTTTSPQATTTSTTAPTTATSVPPTSTTTTTSATGTYSRTFDTQAGSVRVIVEGDEVRFGGAFPNPGWTVELEDAGPEQVKVHFERNDESGEVQFSARLEDGELVTRIESDGHDD